MRHTPQTQWRRVVVPRVWRPKQGEELIGEYLGSEARVGQFGPYRVHLVRTRGHTTKAVSGTMVDALFAMVPHNSTVKLVFSGMKKVQDSDRTYKSFELYIEETIELKAVS